MSRTQFKKYNSSALLSFKITQNPMWMCFKACNSARVHFHLHPKRHTYDTMMLETSRGGWREKKSWQIHKAVWLHHGHVAAFTNTVWSNLTSLPSSLPLSVSLSLQDKVPVWHIGLKNYVKSILYICTDVLRMEITVDWAVLVWMEGYKNHIRWTLTLITVETFTW